MLLNFLSWAYLASHLGTVNDLKFVQMCVDLAVGSNAELNNKT